MLLYIYQLESKVITFYDNASHLPSFYFIKTIFTITLELHTDFFINQISTQKEDTDIRKESIIRLTGSLPKGFHKQDLLCV